MVTNDGDDNDGDDNDSDDNDSDDIGSVRIDRQVAHLRLNVGECNIAFIKAVGRKRIIISPGYWDFSSSL